MSRVRLLSVLARAAGLLVLPMALAACSTQARSSRDAAAPAPEPLAVTAATIESAAVERFLRVTGSLAPDEQAEVSAETGGRIVDTPVERGTPVTKGAVLVRISAEETSAQLQEAQANAAQIEAGLGLAPNQAFDPDAVPDVMNAKAALDLAEAEFGRIRSLLDQWVVSQSEFDQRRAQVEAARQQFLVARNGAEQSFRALQAARARVALAGKSVADTVVRAPFSGVVAERLVSVGDYVARGTRVATVVRVDPLRVELTLPETYLAQVRVGQEVRLAVDAYPGESFAAAVRFISPSLRTEQRALTIEAVAPNRDGRLKPGLFATARLKTPTPAPALLVPAASVETVAGTSRVYVVKDGAADERIVTLGDRVGDRVELTSGAAAGELVVTDPRGRLTDGRLVTVKP